MNDRIGSFATYYGCQPINEPATEGALGELVASTLFLVAGCVAITIKNRREAKKELEAKKAKAAEDAKRAKEMYPIQIKKAYGIDLKVYEPGFFAKTNELTNSMLKDVKIWVNKITHSALYESLVDDLLHDGEVCKGIHVEYTSDPKFKVTPQYILSNINVAKGINGIEESIQINDGTQTECDEMSWICEDVANMLKHCYGAYLKYVKIGDGDEGHVYYEINYDALSK